jgi:hypothetical protein
MRWIANLKADWLSGWRGIGREGKAEYAFMVTLVLLGLAAGGYIVWFAYIVPFMGLLS